MVMRCGNALYQAVALKFKNIFWKHEIQTVEIIFKCEKYSQSLKWYEKSSRRFSLTQKDTIFSVAWYRP